MKKRLLTLLVAMIMVLSLVACGKPATVEEYYSQPVLKEALDAQMEELKASYEGVYSDLGYTVEGNTFGYYYQYAVQIEDVEEAKKVVAASLTEEMMADIVADVSAECGVTDITLKYTFYNADGTLIYEDTYPQ